MDCTTCKRPILEARLAALKKLGLQDTRCIECAGKEDVPQVKRFDEWSGEEEIQTYFTQNTYIEGAIKELMETPLPDLSTFNITSDDPQSEDRALAFASNARPLEEDED